MTPHPTTALRLPQRREIAVEVRVLDEKSGLVEYIASDESIDSYREVVRADGWRFNRFAKNAPFVDSHRYDSIECVLGKVVDARVDKRRLVEVVQWAIDVPENRRAQIGWAMTQAGYLRAVSVGFQPIRLVSRWDSDRAGWLGQLKDLGLLEEDGVNAVYLEQEQLELSAVVIGANPNAVVSLARAYKSGALDDQALEYIHKHFPAALPPSRDTASAASAPGPAADEARAQARREFVAEMNRMIRRF